MPLSRAHLSNRTTWRIDQPHGSETADIPSGTGIWAVIRAPTPEFYLGDSKMAANRAERRHHKRRMKEKARRIAGEIWGYAKNGQEHQGAINGMVKNCDNLKVCSCAMCGNYRRFNGKSASAKTRQELRSLESLRVTPRPGYCSGDEPGYDECFESMFGDEGY